MIVINNLDFSYPGAESKALDGISLTIQQGSLFGLLGPNGAGKTTLISILTGLLPCNGQDVLINHQPLAGSRSSVKKLTGYVPQDYAFYPNLTAVENLQFFAGIQGITGAAGKQRIDYCIDFCQLQNVASQRASRLSGGLKRRLNIAIGLLAVPEILYFDEPTVGIDPQSRAFILDKIRMLNLQGKTIIYTSHYMEEVEQLCDHLAIIDHGKLLAHGSLNDLKEAQNARLLVECRTSLKPEELEQLREYFPVTVADRELLFGTIYNPQEISKVIDRMASMNIEIVQMHYGRMNLEKLFLQLTNRNLRD
jgi:ABC-2 type transport system ATP-binding protein